MIKDIISDLSVKIDDTLLFTLKRMDELGRKLLLVFDQDVYVGLVSIGDLQRAIIANIDYSTKLEYILRNDIITANKSDSLEEIKKVMLEMRTEFMPVLYKKKVVDIIFWEDIFPTAKPDFRVKINIPVVVMAGGEGTRLKPLTNVLPKPLIPLDDRTIVEHILDRFEGIGCNQFFFSVNYKHEVIEYYFKTLQRKKYNIEYFHESSPLGTAGSLHLLKGKIDRTFFVTNCDIIIDQDYSEVYKYHCDAKNELTVVAALKQLDMPYGTIETLENGRLIGLREKPSFTFKINSGLYILEPHLLKEIPENKFFHITDLIQKIIDRNGIVGVFPVSEKSWIDIGMWDQYFNYIFKTKV